MTKGLLLSLVKLVGLLHSWGMDPVEVEVDGRRWGIEREAVDASHLYLWVSAGSPGGLGRRRLSYCHGHARAHGHGWPSRSRFPRRASTASIPCPSQRLADSTAPALHVGFLVADGRNVATAGTKIYE